MDLKEQLESLKSNWGLVMAAVAAGPLALWTANLQPPWPSASPVVATTACAVAVWLALGVKMVVRRPYVLKSLGVGAIGAGLALGAWYFAANARYVQWLEKETDAGVQQIAIVVGDELKPGVVLGDKSSHDALLDNLGYADRIWTESSIRRARLTLLVTFVASFGFLSFGSAVVSQFSRRKASTAKGT